MTLTATRTVVKKRAFPVVMTIFLLGFLGVSAMAGGLALLLDLDGTRPPISWLDEVPVVDSYLIPGLVLGVGFGVVSIVTTYGMIRRQRWNWVGGLEHVSRHHWSWIATILLGAGQVVWIGLEILYLPDLSRPQQATVTTSLCGMVSARKSTSFFTIRLHAFEITVNGACDRDIGSDLRD